MPRMRSRVPPAVNVTPLVDVLLILLVVLLLAMPLYVKRLPVDLPQTSLAGAPTPIMALAISIKKDATLVVRDAPASLESVLGQVTPKTTIELSVDKDTTYEVMAKTLAQLQAKNPKEIILLTR